MKTVAIVVLLVIASVIKLNHGKPINDQDILMNRDHENEQGSFVEVTLRKKRETRPIPIWIGLGGGGRGGKRKKRTPSSLPPLTGFGG